MVAKVHAALPRRQAAAVPLRREQHVRTIARVQLDVHHPRDASGVALEDFREVPRRERGLGGGAERADARAVGLEHRAVADVAVIQAVVEVARMIFGRDEMDRALAVVRELQIRTVAALAVEPASAVLPRLPVVVREHVVRIVMERANEVVEAAVRHPEQVRVGGVVAGPGRIVARASRQTDAGPHASGLCGSEMR